MDFNRIIQLKNPQMYGEDIKDLQKVLLQKGFDCGRIDGYYGKNTLGAVKLFQKENKLDVDGIVGQKTREKLFKKGNTLHNVIKTVCIDVGHGGKDSGTLNGLYKEKDIVLDVTLTLKKLLETKGIKVILTRDSDITLNQNERVSRINNSNADLLISNHINSGGGDGCEVYYSKSNGIGKKLAESISNNISTALNIVNRGAKTRINDKGEDYYFVIRRSKMTALIVEYIFLDNISNLDILKNEYNSVINKMAVAVCKSIKFN